VKGLRLAALVLTLAFVLVLGGSLLAGLFRGHPTGTAPPAATAASHPRVTVEVLNAAGVAGLAREVTRRLRDAGFDVVYFGNAHAFGQDSSLVLDRVGEPEAAQRVAEALGLARVVSRRDSTLMVDVTVVVGRDWRGAAEEARADSAGG
jgi:hypothetical protein